MLVNAAQVSKDNQIFVEIKPMQQTHPIRLYKS
jgi:hypothetical protein